MTVWSRRSSRHVRHLQGPDPFEPADNLLTDIRRGPFSKLFQPRSTEFPFLNREPELLYGDHDAGQDQHGEEQKQLTVTMAAHARPTQAQV